MMFYGIHRLNRVSYRTAFPLAAHWLSIQVELWASPWERVTVSFTEWFP
jgi:hypothetical protein